MPKKTGKKSRSRARAKGQEMIDGLRELARVLRSGELLSSRFVVRTYNPTLAGDAEVGVWIVNPTSGGVGWNDASRPRAK